MINSQRSRNITLSADAHFYLANVGSAWVALNYPARSGLEWSIVTLIDLRVRPDGFINTPPVASIVSPQYAFVNQTIEIDIPVSDVNAGDDVRCRWAKYTSGYRRRRSDLEKQIFSQSAIQSYQKVGVSESLTVTKKKRTSCGGCGTCNSACDLHCACCCGDCHSSTCNGTTCTLSGGCRSAATTSASTTDSTTTVETPGILRTTSSYPQRQAIDECGDICYPGSVPNDTILSNCKVTFTGLRANTWYAIALQVSKLLYKHYSLKNIYLSKYFFHHRLKILSIIQALHR